MFTILKRCHRYFLLFSVGFLSLLALSVAQAQGPVNALLHQANDPVGGNPKGKVTVVEFFDYQCSHCIEMAPVIADIIKKNGNVRIVFKDFPIRGPMSEFAARAAIAANLQGKYYPLHHAILMTDKPLTAELVYELAKSKGIDVDKLKNDMNSDAVNNQLNANQQLAQQINLSGTPAFFIAKTNEQNDSNVEFVLGQMTEQQLEDLIKKYQ